MYVFVDSRTGQALPSAHSTLPPARSSNHSHCPRSSTQNALALRTLPAARLLRLLPHRTSHQPLQLLRLLPLPLTLKLVVGLLPFLLTRRQTPQLAQLVRRRLRAAHRLLSRLLSFVSRHLLVLLNRGKRVSHNRLISRLARVLDRRDGHAAFYRLLL